VILRSADPPEAQQEASDDIFASEQRESLLCLSAAQEPALRALAERYVEYLGRSEKDFRDICHTAIAGRAKLVHRLAVRARTATSASELLRAWLAGDAVAAVMTSAAERPDPHLRQAGPADALEEIQREFVEGGSPQSKAASGVEKRRRVDLPVYPFQRKRYWFGNPPVVRERREREEAWRLALNAATTQSLQGPIGWHPEQYPARWQALERLTRAHARNVLVAAGAFRDAGAMSLGDVMLGCGFQPIYRKLVGRWLSSLAEEGWLTGAGEEFYAVDGLQPIDLAPYWQDAERWLSGDPEALAYLKQCGVLLGEVVAGRKSALETIFPDGSFALAEGIYESSELARYMHPILACAVREITQALGKKRNVRILEAGGGTGSTTSAILSLLPPRHVEYLFTDMSEFFLQRARRRFAEYDFVRYGLVDIDREMESQGLSPHSFDIIVAANVIHAARSLEAALRRLDFLLRPGGMLILLETTSHHAWFDMSTGLIEGWQHFEDAERQEHPLLSPDRWRAALEVAGFEEMLALPGPESPVAHIGQHILLARRPLDRVSQSLGESRNATPSALRKESIHQDDRVASSALSPASPEYAGELRALAPELREQRIAVVVRETICRVFQLETRAEEIGDRDRLTDLGMDSLIALELRTELSKDLDLEGKLSSTIAFDTGTVGELIRSLAALIAPPAESRTALPKAEPSFVDAEQLAAMSDEEVEQLLKERLSKP
jgi:SAM-dependent methyltransferase/acyl carrier protein